MTVYLNYRLLRILNNVTKNSSFVKHLLLMQVVTIKQGRSFLASSQTLVILTFLLSPSKGCWIICICSIRTLSEHRNYLASRFSRDAKIGEDSFFVYSCCKNNVKISLETLFKITSESDEGF